MKKLQAVTAADVQRVMKQYFKDNNRVVIHTKQAAYRTYIVALRVPMPPTARR